MLKDYVMVHKLGKTEQSELTTFKRMIFQICWGDNLENITVELKKWNAIMSKTSSSGSKDL